MSSILISKSTLRNALLSSILLCLGCTHASAAENLMDRSNWTRIDNKYWSYREATESSPAQIQRIVYKGTAGGEGQVTNLTQSTFIPLDGAGRYEVSGIISTSGETGKARQTIVTTFYDRNGKKTGESEIKPEYSFAKPAHIRGWVEAPAGSTKAQLTLRIYFLKPFDQNTNIRFAELTFLPEKEALAQATLGKKKSADMPRPEPTKFDPEDSGPVTRGNLSLGKFYRSNRPNVTAFPDIYPSSWSDGIRLTDGRFQAPDSTDFIKTYFAGWRGLDPVEITIDLGRPQLLEDVIIRGYHSDEGNFFIPQSFSVAIRNADDQPWQELGQFDVPGYENFTNEHYVLEMKVPPTQGRFVKLTFQPRGEHWISTLLLEEIELWGQIKNTWRKVPSEGALHGAFPTSAGFTQEVLNGRSGMVVDLYEEMVGKPLAMVLWYQRMELGRPFIEIQRYRDDELAANYYGRRFLQVGWEPRNLDDIINGKLDAYLEEYFRDSIDPEIIGDCTDPIWFRPISEFNGGWVDWGLDPENFRLAWWRIYNIAEQVGATDHHIFVWGPNHRSYPEVEWNLVENYYPGDQYVDWVGISTYPPSSRFVQDEDRRYPVKNVREIYEKYAHYKPIMITEGAFSSFVDRVRFVDEWFRGLKEHRPKIKIVVWENHNDRVISHDEKALKLYRELVQDPYWISQTWSEEKED